jgi:hypothetical protein
MTLKPQQQQQKNPRQQQPQVQQPKATPQVAAAAASTASKKTYSYPDDVYTKAVETMEAHFKHKMGCRSYHIFGSCHSLNNGAVCKYKHEGTAGQFEPDASLRCAYVPYADRANNKRKAGK